MKSRQLALYLIPSAIGLVQAAANTTCSGTFSKLTAAEWVKAMNPAWNLGNTMDATPTEGSWNNPPVVPSTFDDVKAKGFKGVRLPVTWADHFVTGSPDWQIDPTWLDRVEEVVDEVIARDLFAIVNAHHDSWMWADVSAAGANISMIEEKFTAMWVQIAQKLACKSSLLAFEPMNEPPGTTQEHADEWNRLNGLFLESINSVGGFNSERVVTLVGLGEDSIKTSQWFVMPTGFPNPTAIQYHYYSPYDFIFSAWGKTIWGSDADKASLETDFMLIRDNFTDVPLLIGEFDASTINCEPSGRRKYTDFVMRTAAKYDTSVTIWDNGLDQLDRDSGIWRDPTEIDILINAQRGINNSLPDSTEDLNAISQWTSSYIFQKAGEAVTDQVLPFILNGNRVTSISAPSGNLRLTTDYSLTPTATGTNITFPAKTLQTFFDGKTLGNTANFTVRFSAGASVVVSLVQWSLPVLSSTSSTATDGSVDLDIPIAWNGVPQPAAVRAVESDGTYFADSWTEFLGPLQQARVTYSSQFNWDAQHFIIPAAAVQAVMAAGKATTFTIETFPRQPGNAVNYTLNV